MPKLSRLSIAKDYLKFSCAHMTVFSATEKERLHGHNYRVKLELVYRSTEDHPIVDVRAIKEIASKLCAAWDEHVLLAEKNPYFAIASSGPWDGGNLTFRQCGKFYSLPADEVVLLPLDNISMEALASHLVDRFRLAAVSEPWFGLVSEVSVFVEESDGQGAWSRWTKSE